jgi:hypothetical protein
MQTIKQDNWNVVKIAINAIKGDKEIASLFFFSFVFTVDIPSSQCYNQVLTNSFYFWSGPW